MRDGGILTRVAGRNSACGRPRRGPRLWASGEDFKPPTPGVSATGWRSEGTDSIEVYRQMTSSRNSRPGPRVILLSLAVATARLQLVRFLVSIVQSFSENLAQRG